MYCCFIDILVRSMTKLEMKMTLFVLAGAGEEREIRDEHDK
jgi:hypothetical protein